MEDAVTTIRATCPTCGEVELTPDDITLRVCTHGPASYYEFGCPLCAEQIQKPADERVVQLLISGGVAATVWELPQEFNEQHDGAPFTMDDILDLHLLLDSSDWFERLLKVGANS